MKSKEIFVTTDLVGIGGQLSTLSVYEDWRVTYEEPSRIDTIDIPAESALCLSAIMSLCDKLTSVSDRDEEMERLRIKSLERGMNPTTFFTVDTDIIHDRKRRSAESLLTKKNFVVYPNLFVIGFIGAKKLFLCRNVQFVYNGLDIINHAYLDEEQEALSNATQKQFLKEYRNRELDYEAKKLEIAVIPRDKKPIKKVPIEEGTPIEDTTEQAFISQADEATLDLTEVSVQTQTEYIAELVAKYTPADEYARSMIKYIFDLDNGVIFDEKQLEDFVKEQGFSPNPADIGRILLSSARLGWFKKSFVGEAKKTEQVKLVRFNKS